MVKSKSQKILKKVEEFPEDVLENCDDFIDSDNEQIISDVEMMDEESDIEQTQGKYNFDSDEEMMDGTDENCDEDDEEVDDSDEEIVNKNEINNKEQDKLVDDLLPAEDSEEDSEEDEQIKLEEKKKAFKEKNERSVFVGNLTNKITKKVLIQLFQSKKGAGPGSVESVRIRGAVATTNQAKKRSVIQKDFSNGDSQVLCAFIVLNKKEDLEKCLNLNNHVVDGRHIRVDRVGDKKKMTYNQKHCVFIGNLPFTVMEDQVREQLEKYGDIVNIRLVRDKSTGKVKGFGYVEFSDNEGATYAIKMNEAITMDGRKIRIKKYTDSETQKGKRHNGHPKNKPKIKNEDGKNNNKLKVVVPSNMGNLELKEYIKTKKIKQSKKMDKKRKEIKNKSAKKAKHV